MTEMFTIIRIVHPENMKEVQQVLDILRGINTLGFSAAIRTTPYNGQKYEFDEIVPGKRTMEKKRQ
jgi:hypothetical protein